jgi:hypothetical protein
MKGPLYAARKMLTPEERSKLEEQNAKAKAICEVDRLTRKLRDQIELARGVAIDDEISGGRHGFMRHHKSQMNETWSRLTEILPHEETEAKWGQRKADEVVDILISNQEEGLEWLEEIRRKLLTNELYVMHRDETRRRMERVRTREEWWLDPGRTYHRYVKPIPHPQCAAEYNSVMRHFTGIWSPADILTNQFKEAKRGEKWFMEGIPPEIQRTVAETWARTGTNENLLKQIVRTRQHLSAIGLDGISYHIFQLGGDNAVKWMMKVFTKLIQEKRVPEIWKQARTVLLYKKGDDKDAANYRPISITCCLYRIFTALIAKFIQTTNRSRGNKIFSTEQKGREKRTPYDCAKRTPYDCAKTATRRQ